jgi:hypothetical protein
MVIIIKFMKKKILIGVAILLMGFLMGGITFYALGKLTQQRYMPYTVTPNVPRQIMETGRAFSEIVGAVSPSVVNISTTKVIKRDPGPLSDDPFFDLFRPFNEYGTPKKWKERSLGSGVIVSPDGYIITNNHVVEKADEIKVTLVDKRAFKGHIVGADPKADIAIIRIDANNLPVLRWGDSERLQVGRRDQSRKFRRPARERQGRTYRDKYCHILKNRRLSGHRICGTEQHGASRYGSTHSKRKGYEGVDRSYYSGAHT